MICRACGREERASEGYQCADCGTFICLMCSFKGVLRCTRCAEALAKAPAPVPAPAPVQPPPVPVVAESPAPPAAVPPTAPPDDA